MVLSYKDGVLAGPGVSIGGTWGMPPGVKQDWRRHNPINVMIFLSNLFFLNFIFLMWMLMQ